MGNWFSSSNTITAHDRAVLDLKSQRDKLKLYANKETNYAKRTLKESHSLTEEAQKEQKRANARRALRRKKYQEKLLLQAESTLENVAEMIDSLEFAAVETNVMAGLRQGNAVLKNLHEQIGGADGVESVVSETEDMIERQNEIDAILSGALSTEDDAECEEELARLQLEHAAVAPNTIPDEIEVETVAEKAKKERVLA